MPHFGEMLATVAGVQSAGPNASITPSGSPFTYTAAHNGRVIISGGTVTTVELGRNGSFAVVGLLAGIVPVSKFDQVRVTYLVAPTMTFMPT